MKIRKSTSLLAGACTLCIAAASGTVEPQRAPVAQQESLAQQQSTVRVVSRDVMLAAAVNPLGAIAAVGAATPAATDPISALIQLPFQNYFQIFGNGVTYGPPPTPAVKIYGLGTLSDPIVPLNAAMGTFFQGLPTGSYKDPITGATVTGTPTELLNDAVQMAITATNLVLAMPGQVIAYDIAVITAAFTPPAMAATAGAAAASPLALTTAATPAAATVGTNTTTSVTDTKGKNGADPTNNVASTSGPVVKTLTAAAGTDTEDTSGTDPATKSGPDKGGTTKGGTDTTTKGGAKKNSVTNTSGTNTSGADSKDKGGAKKNGGTK